jgi:dCMP deaminase
MNDIDLKWMKGAYQFARNSPDPSTQNGAVLVDFQDPRHPDGYFVTGACNTFPNGVRVTHERLERPLKYSVIEHAERNVIYSAAALGEKVRGLTMYCPWFACAECARAIIQSGVIEVVGHQSIFDLPDSRWKESITLAHTLLREADVAIRIVDGKVGEAIRFDGTLQEL